MATFFIYLLVLFDLVFLSDAFGRVNAEVLRYQKVNLVPFKTIRNYFSVMAGARWGMFVTNVVGNVVAFLPFGFLVPTIFESKRRWYHGILLSLMLSTFIELVQGYLGVGVMDVDDLILNVFGGYLGFLLFLITSYWLKKLAKRSL